ncbi:bilirubin oxidase [Volucribacter amazonae]|uniref:Bilirubin oxidase n=1 Tax=Volucribacter amazonae TaxID=256731 RepID=A0A9X4SHF2_9PAST|nr:bilirubin oxidase [Volucribacter amazonae]
MANEGDRIELELHNQLDEPTTLHCHGLPAPSDQDGNPQDPVEPGQSRIYQFTLPKGCAGTYWYHTHAHGLTASQAYKGLAGAFIVKAKDDPLSFLPEQHWLISDLRLDNNAQIPGNEVFDWINGREGQFTLINGQRQPKITLTGQERIRIWNACSAKYLRLAIPHCEFIVVGTDGGLLEQPQSPVSELLLAPAERYEVIVKIHQTGQTNLQNLPYNRGKMFVPFEPITQTLANIELTPQQELVIPNKLRQIDDFGAITAQKEVTFVERQHHHIDWENLSEQETQDILKNMFLVNGKTYDMNRVDLVSKVNEVEEWSIFNISHMDHPFHIHGTQFIVLEHIFEDKSYKPVKALKDTVNIRPYELVKIKIVQRQKGLRMFHCHILEHENLGMMAQLNVV